jgi:predicted nucleic acid-binding protein
MKKSTRLSTKNETFVDTSGFYTLLVKGDAMHERASVLLARARQSRRRFVTTDYVLDETATLLKARGYATSPSTCLQSSWPLRHAGLSGWIPNGLPRRSGSF